jgi:hypothetical protein
MFSRMGQHFAEVADELGTIFFENQTTILEEDCLAPNTNQPKHPFVLLM